MKSFDEWFEKEYGNLYNNTALNGAFKEVAFNAWQSAQEVQRESDADIAYNNDNDFLYDAIRNNKAV